MRQNTRRASISLTVLCLLDPATRYPDLSTLTPSLPRFILSLNLDLVCTPEGNEDIVQLFLVAPLHEHVSLIHDEGSGLEPAHTRARGGRRGGGRRRRRRNENVAFIGVSQVLVERIAALTLPVSLQGRLLLRRIRSSCVPPQL